MSKTVNLTPTWMGIYPLLCQFIDGGNKTQIAHVKDELRRLCILADKVKHLEESGELQINKKSSFIRFTENAQKTINNHERIYNQDELARQKRKAKQIIEDMSLELMDLEYIALLILKAAYDAETKEEGK